MSSIRPIGDLGDIQVGKAVICYGGKCLPKVGRFAGMPLPAGWRSPSGEITADREKATMWASELDKWMRELEAKK